MATVLINHLHTLLDAQPEEEAINAIEQYKAQNPGNMDEILSTENELLTMLRRLSSREVDKFVTYAKEQGTEMPFETMEMGILLVERTCKTGWKK